MSAERILIDGRSGSGKTELGRLVAARLPGAQLVRLDDLYPGWDGLRAGADHVVEHVLAARPRWRAWDWVADSAGPWHSLDPDRPIVVEGCGALTRASRARAGLGVWVELDATTRRSRALARDGDAYAPHWDRWARQEEELLAVERSPELADLVLDGSMIDAASADRVLAAAQPQPSSCS